MLSFAYFSISDSFQKKSENAAQRLGVDLITKLAFDSEDTSIHNLLCVSWFGHPRAVDDGIFLGWSQICACPLVQTQTFV